MSSSINHTGFPPDLYFRQLSPGRDIATTRSRVHSFAQQMANYIYVIGDRSTKEAVVIDGGWDPKGIAAVVLKDGMNLKAHIATHYHWDHIGAAEKQGLRIPGLKDWIEEYQLPAWVPEWEIDVAAAQIDVPTEHLSPISHAQCMKLGRFGLDFIHTPGHSPGSMCIRVSDRPRGNEANNSLSSEYEKEHGRENGNEVKDLLLVTGDTVFPGSCGRLDLPDSDPLIMYDSLKKVAALPDDLPLFPGHSYSGPSSTIRREKATGLLRSDITREQWKRMMVR